MRIRLKHRRLAELIAAGGITQNHWAIKLGLSRGHWSGLVNGNHPFPSAKTRTRILDSFAVPFDELFEIDVAGDAWADVDFRRALAERYLIDAEIGQGGMGAVYMARDVRHGRLVAIKVIAPEAVSGIGVVQFRREISTVAQLLHPHILALHESGEVAEQPYFVMPYVREGSLRSLVQREGRLSVPRTITLVRGIADALDHAHADHVLHCDIKPENVLLHKQHAWLTDFGIARKLHAETDVWPSRDGIDISAGTPAYVSPEQASGDRNLDARSDVYSLGCVVYEMLAGRAPFSGASTQQVVSRRFIEPAPPLRDFAPDVPADVEAVIAHAMALRRENRYSSAGVFSEHLERAFQSQSTRGRRASRTVWRGVSRAQQTLGLFPRHPIGGTVRNFATDVRAAWRVTRRNVKFSALAALTLALGVGAVTSAFAILDTVLLRPLPYAHGERLVRVREITAKGAPRAPSYPNFDGWRTHARSFSGMAAASSSPSRTIQLGNEPVRASAIAVSRGFLQVVGAPPIAGREFGEDEAKPGGPSVVMVSESFWHARLNAAPMPMELLLNEVKYTAIGVVPSYVRLLGAPDLYFSTDRFPGTVRSAHAYMVIARLADSIPIEAARAEMTSLSSAMLKEYGSSTEAADARVTLLHDDIVGDSRSMLPFVLGAAAIVLLIACTNVVSLNLARGLGRARELAIRGALGASRSRIVRQLFVESGFVVVAGVALGSGLAFMVTRTVRTLGAGAGLVPRLEELAVDARVLAFSAAVMIVSTLLVGIYPALRLTRAQNGTMLRESRDGRGSIRIPVWRVLVGVQTGLALALLVGCGLLVRTMVNILSSDTGFDAHGIITVDFTPREGMLNDLRRIETGLRGTAGVSGVAFANHLPMDWGSYSAPLLRPSDPVDRNWPALAGIRVVTPGYFEVLRQRVVRGRTFTSADDSSAGVVAILTSGAAARLWPGEDPIGKTVATTYDTKRWMRVVGIVDEAASWTMERGAQHEIYIPLEQWPMHAQNELVAVVRATGSVAATLPAVRARLRELLPDVPVRLSTVDAVIGSSAVQRRFATGALATFAAIALLLAATGIYGVASYSVATRRREIGVRLALGATPGSVRRRVLRDALIMVGGGLVIGGVGAIFATRYLRASLYGVTNLDPIAYAIGAGVLVVATLLGAYVPAWRSSRVDPLTELRAD